MGGEDEIWWGRADCGAMERLERSGRGGCSDRVVAVSSIDFSAIVIVGMLRSRNGRRAQLKCAKHSGGIPPFKSLGGPGKLQSFTM